MFIKFSNWLVYDIVQIKAMSSFGNTLQFFISSSLKITLLVFLLITIKAFLRSYLDYDKFRKYIESKPKLIAYFLIAILGAVTPFCSCSSIPLFLGFIEAGIPFGMAMTFLITSPMINEIAVFVLASVVGIKITIIYVVTGLTVGISGGVVMEKLGLQNYIKSHVNQVHNHSPKIGIKHKYAREKIYDSITYAFGVLSKILPYILIGIAVGSFIHGYVSQEFFVKYLNSGNIFSVPISVVVGIPLYADATGIVSIAQVLINKGGAIGTTLAFMMATVALSLPELIILSSVMKKTLIWSFIGFMFLSFVCVGYFYNIIF